MNFVWYSISYTNPLYLPLIQCDRYCVFCLFKFLVASADWNSFTPGRLHAFLWFTHTSDIARCSLVQNTMKSNYNNVCVFWCQIYIMLMIVVYLMVFCIILGLTAIMTIKIISQTLSLLYHVDYAMQYMVQKNPSCLDPSNLNLSNIDI